MQCSINYSYSTRFSLARTYLLVFRRPNKSQLWWMKSRKWNIQGEKTLLSRCTSLWFALQHRLTVAADATWPAGRKLVTSRQSWGQPAPQLYRSINRSVLSLLFLARAWTTKDLHLVLSPVLAIVSSDRPLFLRSFSMAPLHVSLGLLLSFFSCGVHQKAVLRTESRSMRHTCPSNRKRRSWIVSAATYSLPFSQPLVFGQKILFICGKYLVCDTSSFLSIEALVFKHSDRYRRLLKSCFSRSWFYVDGEANGAPEGQHCESLVGFADPRVDLLFTVTISYHLAA